MVDRNQMDRLLKVKKLRRILAQTKAAKAHRELRDAGHALENAKASAVQVNQEAHGRLRHRIDAVLDIPNANQNLLNTRIANLWHVGQQEISDAVQIVSRRGEEATQALEKTHERRQQLARYLRREKQTEGLCDRLAELERQQVLKGS